MRWSPPEAVQDHFERVTIYADGKARRDVNITFSEEQYREMVQGYRCCRCLAHVNEAFPETCGFPGCDGYPDGFPMRERQREVMEREFDGHEWIGISRETHEQEMNELDADTYKHKPHIWVPGKD